MPSRNNLSAQRCATAPAGRHSDGGGLILAKQDTGAGQWLYRYQTAGRRREMGLGAYGLVA
jgi:hypothetical protein